VCPKGRPEAALPAGSHRKGPHHEGAGLNFLADRNGYCTMRRIRGWPKMVSYITISSSPMRSGGTSLRKKVASAGLLVGAPRASVVGFRPEVSPGWPQRL